MDYDFFDEEQNENSKENVGERIPAPVINVTCSKKTPKKRKLRWQYVVAAVAVGISVFFTGWLTCWLTLDKEIRTLIDVKNKIQQNYYKEVSDDEFYTAVFGGINDDLLDAYSEYMTREEFRLYLQDMQGNRIGIGLVFAGGKNQNLEIVRVCGNSPAEKAGLVAGETVLGIGKTKDSIVPCSTFDELSALLDEYGEKEEFFLEISGRESLVSLYKDEYVENLVFYRTNAKAYTFEGADASEIAQKGEPMQYLDEDTAYIQLVSFTGNAAKAFDLAMEKFKVDGKKNLVLDLRGNGGGYLDVMQSIASYFCKTANEEKPVAAVADYGEKKQEYRAYGNYYFRYFAEDSRIAVLADSDSASASECLLGCMIDYGAISYADICLAERAGIAKTYGKGIMQETHLVNLFYQDAIKLTTAEIRWPKGNSIHGRGILLTDGTATVKEMKGEQETQRAIEILFEKK